MPWLPALSGGAGGLRLPRGLPAPRPLGAELGARDGRDTDPSAWAAHARGPITPAHTPYTHHTHTPNTRPPRARKTRAPRQRTHTAHTTRATPGPRPDAANARSAHARPTLTRDRDAGGCARGTGAQRPHSRSRRRRRPVPLPFALRGPTLPPESLQRRGPGARTPGPSVGVAPGGPHPASRGEAPAPAPPGPRRARGGLGARLTPGEGARSWKGWEGLNPDPDLGAPPPPGPIRRLREGWGGHSGRAREGPRGSRSPGARVSGRSGPFPPQENRSGSVTCFVR